MKVNYLVFLLFSISLFSQKTIVPIAYFTMPSGITNGHTANLTAIAVTGAIKATNIYYVENPTITDIALGQYFKNRLL